MSREARSRVVLGAGIPLAAFLFLGLLIFAFSRILLAVPEELAPWVALLFATNILVGCALAAMIPGTRGFTFLIGVLVATIVIGGIAGWVIGPRDVHSPVAEDAHASEEPGPAEDVPPADQPPPPEPGSTPTVGTEIVAQDLAFQTAELEFPADTPITILLNNRDEAVPHNVGIYESQGGEPLFQGELVTGPAKIDYQIPQLAAGEYFFQCDVHPTTMNGSLTVA